MVHCQTPISAEQAKWH